MKALIATALLLIATVAAAQPTTNPAADDLQRIQRLCPSVAATMSREALLAAVADCLDRFAPAQPARAASGLSSIQLSPSHEGRLMVRSYNGHQIYYPDPALTPGVLSSRTAADVCATGFRTNSVRKTTQGMKDKVYTAYGLDPHHAPCPCEVDHWLSLEDEGADGGEVRIEQITTNLWPEPYSDPYGARNKDRVETWIHMQLCSGEIDRDQALDYMAHWPEIYDALKSGTNPFSAAGYEPEPSP